MRIHIINTGTELMLGRILNTHQQWLCRQLADRGYTVTRQVSVADTAPDIQRAVAEVLTDSDLIIVTGGLGPTSDDRTRDLIAQLLDRGLQEDASVLERIEQFFTSRKLRIPAHARVQALVPEGARVLPNACGTAPGLAMDTPPRDDGKRGLLIMLPGPPRELRPMFLEEVVPLLQQRLPVESAFVCRTLKTTGLGESWVEEKIDEPLRPLTGAGLELGYCARTGEVEVRLAARGARAATLVDEAESITRGLLGDFIYGADDDSLEATVIRLLTERRQTLGVAESCTGGCLAHRLTNVPGASAVFLAGLVTYSNAAKQTILGVRPGTLADHGAVSEATAREMAAGARDRLQSDFAISVTGIAGPAGGTPEKPVGTVWMALATAKEIKVRRQFNPYDRETFKYVTSQQALEMLRRALL